jgi:hypothetical protein
MSAMKAGPAVPNWLAAGLIGLVLGSAGGFYGTRWNQKSETTGNQAMGAAMTGPASMGGPGGVGGPGGAGGGGARDHPNAATLVRTVGALATLEKARGQELKPEQRTQVAVVAKALSASDALTEAQCEEQLTKLQAALSLDQKALVEEMTARPGGRGGAPGGGPPAGNGPASGMGGPPAGGGAMDYEHPFKAGRGKERLSDLVKLLEN